MNRNTQNEKIDMQVIFLVNIELKMRVMMVFVGPNLEKVLDSLHKSIQVSYVCQLFLLCSNQLQKKIAGSHSVCFRREATSMYTLSVPPSLIQTPFFKKGQKRKVQSRLWLLVTYSGFQVFLNYFISFIIYFLSLISLSACEG